MSSTTRTDAFNARNRFSRARVLNPDDQVEATAMLGVCGVLLTEVKSEVPPQQTTCSSVWNT